MIQINLFTKQKYIHRPREWTYGCQGGRMRRKVRELGINMYTLLYFKWITNKVLLYSTGNTAHCYVGGKLGGEWVRVCVWLSPFTVHLKLSQRCWLAVCVAQSCWLFVTPWTVAHQAPLSMEFSRQAYWSGLPFPTLGEYKIKSFTKVKSINFVKVNFHIESKRQKENSIYEFHLIEIFTMHSSSHFRISYTVYSLQLFLGVSLVLYVLCSMYYAKLFEYVCNSIIIITWKVEIIPDK